MRHHASESIIRPALNFYFCHPKKHRIFNPKHVQHKWYPIIILSFPFLSFISPCTSFYPSKMPEI
ncbi:Protein of unknown function [Pyronema omphalodes CBS 100304]|uniref:Uncharacterized protein n=1 Tax=Pyronema omphalodes (strain CBS 100304) TaxID=1076935 RepID=U4LFZ8_PYROM|nr:Protein of unknown function [Pyronema omphalodes CBS 100304]